MAGSRYGWDITINCLNSLTAGLRIETGGNYLLGRILIQPVKTINNMQPLIGLDTQQFISQEDLDIYFGLLLALECWSKF